MRRLPAVRVFAVGVMVAAVSSCSKNVTTFNPTPTMHTTFFLKGGTIDVNHPCTPATPPASVDPTPPAAQRILVGYQDWRNTVTDAGGSQCQSSMARRLEGIVTFDMSGVAADINATPFKSLTGTLTYHINSSKVPQSNGIDMCVASLQIAVSAPASGFVPLNFLIGENFPPSSPPSLTAINLPGFAPVGQVTSSGPATVNPAGPDPTVTVEATWILSDWANTKPAELAIAFVPQGPTLAQMGIPNNPVPPSRSTAQCISNVKDIALRVNVGR